MRALLAARRAAATAVAVRPGAHRGSSAPVPRAWSEPRSVPIEQEDDIVVARCAARDLCRDLGFSTVGQTKVATAVSELARNIFQYAGSGEVVIRLLAGEPPTVEIEASDRGPGIEDVDAVLGGRYRSRTGMGKGLCGVRRLMDSFALRSGRGSGTVVQARKARE